VDPALKAISEANKGGYPNFEYKELKYEIDAINEVEGKLQETIENVKK